MEPAKHSSWASAGVRSCESSTTRSGRRPRISSSGSRTVSIGSSASTVPLPVTIAEARARSRCTSARARSPVIHLLVPSASAVRPSKLAPSLRVTHGRPVSMRRTKPRLISAASPASRPCAVRMPACSEPREARAVHARIGVAHRHNDAPHARGDQRLRARRRAPLVRAGLERHVRRGSAGRAAGLVQRHDLGVRLARALVETLAHDLPPAHQHAAHARVRRRRVQAVPGELERPHHVVVIVGGEDGHLRRPPGSGCDHRPSCRSSTVRGRRWRNRSISSRNASTSWKLRYTEAKRT